MQKTAESENSKMEKAELQGVLNNIIVTEPWQLGFSEVYLNYFFSSIFRTTNNLPNISDHLQEVKKSRRSWVV